MTYQTTVQRWDSFLAKTKQRADDLFAQSRQGCGMLLDLNNLDVLPMTNAWTAIEQQVHELAHLIEDTWNDKVEELFEDLDLEQEVIDIEYQKYRSSHQELYHDKERAETLIFADAARKILQRAKEILSKTYSCTQCQAQLEVSDQFFRSVHVPCKYCDKVNTFDPGTQVRSVEDFCCHYLSREQSIDLFLKSQDAESIMRHNDFQFYDDMFKTEQTLREYLVVYLKARIEIVPEYEKDYDKDLKGRMAWFYDEVKRSPIWQEERNSK